MAGSVGKEDWGRLLGDASAVLRRDGVTEASLRAVGLRMQRTAEGFDAHTVAGLKALHGTSSSSTVLRSDSPDGLTLALSRFPPEAATPVHNHGTWGVALVLEGRDHHLHWRRLDDGMAAGRARLEIDADQFVSAGEFVTWLGPPGDIHSQQGVGRAVYELVLFGRNVMTYPRLYFDPRAGTVQERLPQ
jgi:predicted metal-dependent enzyme (double-stranded beta helix superfamily)